MKSVKHSIEEMNRLLDELIETAEELRRISEGVISEEELVPLQRRQNDLLEDLEKLDQDFQKIDRSEIDAGTHERFHRQLHEFQRLNQEFVKNIGRSHGLIQFEHHYLQDETAQIEELESFYSTLHRLNKMSFSENLETPKQKKQDTQDKGHGQDTGLLPEREEQDKQDR